MRETYMEIIEKSITDEERERVISFLRRKDPGKEEITIADIPDCFGFFCSSEKECATCLLKRVCEIAVFKVTLPYVIDFLASQDREMRVKFLKEACGTLAVNTEEIGLKESASVADQKARKKSAGKQKVEMEGTLPSSTVKKERVLDEFGFRVDSNVSKGIALLKKYKRVDEAAVEYARLIGVEVKKAKRLLMQIPYYLRKKGVEVHFENGNIIWQGKK